MQSVQQPKNHRAALVMVLLGGITMATPVPAAPQGLEFREFHTWSDLATIYNFSDRFRYDGDYGIRGLLTGDDWTLVYLRPSVRYQTRSWLRLHGGIALFYTFFEPIEDLPELRPWVGVRFVGPEPGGWVISNYFRLEYRAFYLKDRDEWDPVWRGRWQLQVTTPDFGIRAATGFYALASIENFKDFGASIGGSLVDRIRTNIGMGKRVTPALRIELSYLYHSLRLSESSRDFELDDHVLRLRVFYSFN